MAVEQHENLPAQPIENRGFDRGACQATATTEEAFSPDLLGVLGLKTPLAGPKGKLEARRWNEVDSSPVPGIVSNAAEVPHDGLGLRVTRLVPGPGDDRRPFRRGGAVQSRCYMHLNVGFPKHPCKPALFRTRVGSLLGKPGSAPGRAAVAGDIHANDSAPTPRHRDPRHAALKAFSLPGRLPRRRAANDALDVHFLHRGHEVPERLNGLPAYVRCKQLVVTLLEKVRRFACLTETFEK